MILLHDAHDLMAQPPRPVEWFIDRLVPTGMTMDLFSPPGVGKTTLLTDLALAVASEEGKWHGQACQGGPVVILGGERTDPAALERDLWRTGRRQPPRGALTIPHDKGGDCPPLWRWDRKAGSWDLTPWGREITEWLGGARMALIILDTIMSAAAGSDLLDQPQQYLLGQTIRRWTREVGAGMVVTVSHTNQASASAGLSERLDYLSRAGGNGLPGALRHLGGMTKLRKGEVPGFDPAQDETMFAIGFSKSNESPRPEWTNHKPAIFTQGKAGKLALLADSEEVAERLAGGAGDDQGREASKKRSAKPTANTYQSAKEGRSYAAC